MGNAYDIYYKYTKYTYKDFGDTKQQFLEKLDKVIMRIKERGVLH